MEPPYAEKIAALGLQKFWYNDPDEDGAGEKLLVEAIFGEGDFSEIPDDVA